MSSVITPRPSGTWVSPRDDIASAGTRDRSVPSSRTVPRSARTSPETVRSSVVFPAPLAPSTAVTFPRGAVKDTPSSARTGP